MTTPFPPPDRPAAQPEQWQWRKYPEYDETISRTTGLVEPQGNQQATGSRGGGPDLTGRRVRDPRPRELRTGVVLTHITGALLASLVPFGIFGLSYLAVAFQLSVSLADLTAIMVRPAAFLLTVAALLWWTGIRAARGRDAVAAIVANLVAMVLIAGTTAFSALMLIALLPALSIWLLTRPAVRAYIAARRLG